MSKVDVTEEMEEALYQIASVPLRRHEPMSDVENVVLFCGATTDLVVTGSADATLRIAGTSVSMGLSPEAAAASARATALKLDRVEDYAATGPHPGELFAGTNRVDSKPETVAVPCSDFWAWCRSNTGHGVPCMTPDDLFPQLAGCFLPFPEQLSRGLHNAVRVSLVQEKAQALAMPPTAHRPRLDKVFRPNSSTREYLHGPVGYVSLTVSLQPASA